MTLNQLLSETFALGFDENEELTQSFIFAANRAIRTINLDLGDEKLGRILIDNSTEGLSLGDEKKEYNILDYIPDFLYAVKTSFDSSKNKTKDASIIGDKLILPSLFTGEIFIRYKPCTSNLTLDDLEEEIPIPKRCEHLCPILTAAYFWLDDEEEKAAYYMQIYNDEASKMRYGIRKNTDSDYYDITGWAT